MGLSQQPIIACGGTNAAWTSGVEQRLIFFDKIQKFKVFLETGIGPARPILLPFWAANLLDPMSREN
jgi:hypothetical protein